MARLLQHQEWFGFLRNGTRQPGKEKSTVPWISENHYPMCESKNSNSSFSAKANFVLAPGAVFKPEFKSNTELKLHQDMTYQDIITAAEQIGGHVQLANRGNQAAAKKPNHHLWNNHGTWWINFTIHHLDNRVERVRVSLETSDIEQARIRRNEVLNAVETAKS